jgi:hypothetical protein
MEIQLSTDCTMTLEEAIRSSSNIISFELNSILEYYCFSCYRSLFFDYLARWDKTVLSATDQDFNISKEQIRLYFKIE